MKITVIDECCDMYKADLNCLSKVIIFVHGVYFHPPPLPHRRSCKLTVLV